MSESRAPSPPCVFLPWDSSFFGVRIGRVDTGTLNPDQAAALEEWAVAEKIRCVYWLADGTDAPSLSVAARTGFKFVDTRIDLAQRPLPTHAPTAGLGVRPARADDKLALKAIARRSQRDTRFYKDDSFPAGRADDLYAEWIERDMREHHVFVAPAPDGTVAGFVSCQVDEVVGLNRIGLLAVDAAHAGQGRGRSLVDHALAWSAAQGCTEARVATQATNIPALRVYQASGFRIAGTGIWYHRWF